MKPVKLPPGESGAVRGNLTEERVERLAEYYATPEKHRQWEVAEIATLLEISPAKVRKAKSDPRVKKLVKEYLDNQLLYDVVEARAVTMQILRNEKVREDTRLKAVRTIEQLAGNLNNPGPTVNITNDFSSVELSDEQLMAELDNVARRRGFKRFDDNQTLP